MDLLAWNKDTYLMGCNRRHRDCSTQFRGLLFCHMFLHNRLFSKNSMARNISFVGHLQMSNTAWNEVQSNINGLLRPLNAHTAAGSLVTSSMNSNTFKAYSGSRPTVLHMDCVLRWRSDNCSDHSGYWTTSNQLIFNVNVTTN